jgi:hypothetical protein
MFSETTMHFLKTDKSKTKIEKFVQSKFGGRVTRTEWQMVNLSFLSDFRFLEWFISQYLS